MKAYLVPATPIADRAAAPLLFVLGALLSQYAGAAWAKSLLPLLGADGMTGVRVGLSALVLVVILRPWRTTLDRRGAMAVIAYGAMLGAMNLFIYRAMELIPIGVAVAIEVLGPLAVALAGCRRPVDLVWVALAVAGLLVLLPFGGIGADLDPIGIAYAAAAALCWALYIVFGHRAAALPSGPVVAWGLVVAASFTVPLGIADAGSALLAPTVLAVGLAVAVLSSVTPYLLEMLALRRLPRHVFGLADHGERVQDLVVGFLIGEDFEIA